MIRKLKCWFGFHTWEAIGLTWGDDLESSCIYCGEDYFQPVDDKDVI